MKNEIKNLIQEYKTLIITEDMDEATIDKYSTRRIEIQKQLPKEIGIALIFGTI